jgi:hypothetical protein
MARTSSWCPHEHLLLLRSLRESYQQMPGDPESELQPGQERVCWLYYQNTTRNIRLDRQPTMIRGVGPVRYTRRPGSVSTATGATVTGTTNAPPLSDLQAGRFSGSDREPGLRERSEAAACRSDRHRSADAFSRSRLMSRATSNKPVLEDRSEARTGDDGRHRDLIIHDSI